MTANGRKIIINEKAVMAALFQHGMVDRRDGKYTHAGAMLAALEAAAPHLELEKPSEGFFVAFVVVLLLAFYGFIQLAIFVMERVSA